MQTAREKLLEAWKTAERLTQTGTEAEAIAAEAELDRLGAELDRLPQEWTFRPIGGPEQLSE